MKRIILGAIALALFGCNGAPNITVDPTDTVEVVVVDTNKDKWEDILETAVLPEASLAASPGLLDASSTSFISSLGHVVSVVYDAGLINEFVYIWNNPDMVGPEYTAVAEVCRFIWTDFSTVLVARNWSSVPEIPTRLLAREDFAADKISGKFYMPQKKEWEYLLDTDIVKIPGEDKLLAESKAGIREITFTRPLTNPSLMSQMDVATQTQDLLPAGAFKPFTTIASNHRLGAFELVDGDLITSEFEFYNTGGADHIAFCVARDLLGTGLNSPLIEGAWRMGPDNMFWPCADVPNLNCSKWINPSDLEIYNSQKTGANNFGSHMMEVPQWFADQYLGGGKWVAVGGHRGNGAFGGAKGPSLYVFRVEDMVAGNSHLNGIPLMVYPFGSRTWPGYRADCQFSIQWIDNTVIVFVTQGTGVQYYGPGPNCTPDKGYHSEPYEYRIMLIDAKDLGEVALGNQKPWFPQPYDTFPVDWVYTNNDSNCRWLPFKGLDYDEQTRELFIESPLVPNKAGQERQGTIVTVLQMP